MSRLTDLLAKAKAKDADLGRELEREFKALSSRRSFGLNFERHRPENIELPGRPIRKGDKVRILPERRSTKKGDQRLRAGSEGSRIDKLPAVGWGLADRYGLLTDLDQATPFADSIHGKDSIRIAYVVTDDERRFQAVVRQLPDTVEPVRLYESYLTNFRFAAGR